MVFIRKSLTFLIFVLFTMNVYAIIHEVVNVPGVNPNDQTFVVHEEEDAQMPGLKNIRILVIPSNGDEPYQIVKSAKSSFPIKISSVNTNIKSLTTSDTNPIPMYELSEDKILKTQSKINVYLQDEVVSLGREIIKTESFKFERFHRVISRVNGKDGAVFYGLIKEGDMKEGPYKLSNIVPQYDWKKNDIIFFKNDSKLYYDEDDYRYLANDQTGYAFQLISDEAGVVKGHFVKPKPGLKKITNNPSDYEIVKANIALQKRLIPYNDTFIAPVKAEVGLSATAMKNEVKKVEVYFDKIKSAGSVENECQPKAGKVKSEDKSELGKVLTCSINTVYPKKSQRDLSDIFIKKLAPIIDRMLNSPYGPTTKVEKIHFLAQLLHETGGFSTMIEKVDNQCWKDLNKLASENKDNQVCKKYSECAKGNNNFFLNPSTNSKGITSQYTYKDKFRGRFPIQVTHCYNYLGFFKHLDQLKKGKTSEAMKYTSNFSTQAGIKAKSYCTDDELKAIIKHNKSVNLDPLGTLLNPNATNDLNDLSSPCASNKNGYNSHEIMAQASLWYWKTNPNCKQAAKSLTMDESSVLGPTKCINGGTNGLAARIKYFNALKGCMGIK